MQITNRVLMIRPAAFGYNYETAVNNSFQKNPEESRVNERAQEEFDEFVSLLRAEGIFVDVIQDSLEPYTPDSIFPNNWFSTEISINGDRSLVLFPMFAKNRRAEKSSDKIDFIKSIIEAKRVEDLSYLEDKEVFLEGTGSMVIDRENRVIYACESIRTSRKALKIFADKFGYKYVLFGAFDSHDNVIYHTNVMMCVGEKFAVVCLDAIKDLDDRVSLIESLEEFNKEVIEISLEQMENFAGNMLELKGSQNKRVLVMSESARKSLTKNQIDSLEKYCKIISPSLSTIETYGGGSARCMMGEIFY